MKRVIGIALLVVALVILFCGWAVWSEMGDEAGSLSHMRVVDADALAAAKPGEHVVVEGIAVDAKPPLRGPVSGKAAAWYRVRYEHHWQSWAESCSRHHICHHYWRNEHAGAGGDSSHTLNVKIAHSDRELQVAIPDDDQAVARLQKSDEQRTDMKRTATREHRGDYRVTKEYLLAPGTTVTIAGKVSGSGSARTLVPTSGTSLVYQKRRGAMVQDLHGYETVGIYMMLFAALVAGGGLWLVVRPSRAR